MKINAVLKSLSHPIRRDILTRLQNGPISAGDLADAYPVSKPTMSTHFASLKEADLIVGERDGVTILYRLNATVAEEALSTLMGLLGTGETKTSDNLPPVQSKLKSETGR